jgi:UDP-N-acetylmuramate--alanine ligase
MIENKFELAKYLKNSMYGKKLIVGMGAGSISSWIRDLPKLIK